MDWVLRSNFEKLILNGTESLNGTGNSTANLVNGNAGDKALFGMAENDTLTGGVGNDTLDGRPRADSMSGGNGDDSYVMDTTSDRLTESATGGTDAVLAAVSLTLAVHVENLALTGQAAINATGSAAANVLTGNSADNLLSRLAGVGTMSGSLGNDSYTVDFVLDVLFENADEGMDLVTNSIRRRLGSGFENLSLSRQTASNGTGNAQTNAISGNAAGNRLAWAGRELRSERKRSQRYTDGLCACRSLSLQLGQRQLLSQDHRLQRAGGLSGPRRCDRV